MWEQDVRINARIDTLTVGVCRTYLPKYTTTIKQTLPPRQPIQLLCSSTLQNALELPKQDKAQINYKSGSAAHNCAIGTTSLRAASHAMASSTPLARKKYVRSCNRKTVCIVLCVCVCECTCVGHVFFVPVSSCVNLYVCVCGVCVYVCLFTRRIQIARTLTVT